MKVSTNEKLIKRNSTIGNWATLIGLLLLLGSVAIGFYYENLLHIAILVTLAGFIVSQIGMILSTRYGGNPRTDEILNKALKGLPNSNTIHHFTSPVSHLVVGPSGLWAINPRNIRGTIIFDQNRKRYRHVGGGFLTTYLKFFGQGLGRPDLEMQSDVDALRRFFLKNLDGIDELPISAILTFTDQATTVNTENPPFPTMHVSELKQFLRDSAKKRALSDELIEKINNLFSN